MDAARGQGLDWLSLSQAERGYLHNNAWLMGLTERKLTNRACLITNANSDSARWQFTRGQGLLGGPERRVHSGPRTGLFSLLSHTCRGVFQRRHPSSDGPWNEGLRFLYFKNVSVLLSNVLNTDT